MKYLHCAPLVLVLAVSCGTEEPAPTASASSPSPDAWFVTPVDSSTVTGRLLHMRVATSALPEIARVVFYVDDVSDPAGVDDSVPYEFACFDPTWGHGTWHTLSALVDTKAGTKYFTDTVNLFFLPSPLTDTLLASGKFDRRNSHAYLITRLPFSWNSFGWLKNWLEDDSDGQWGMATVSSSSENAFAASLLVPGGIAWLGGFLDSSFTWRWYNGEAWTFDRWPGPSPQNLTEDGLVLKSDGVWTDGARFASLPLILEVSWSP